MADIKTDKPAMKHARTFLHKNDEEFIDRILQETKKKKCKKDNKNGKSIQLKVIYDLLLAFAPISNFFSYIITFSA